MQPDRMCVSHALERKIAGRVWPCRRSVALGVEVERVRDNMRAVSQGDRGMDREKTAFRLRKPMYHEPFCRKQVKSAYPASRSVGGAEQ